MPCLSRHSRCIHTIGLVCICEEGVGITVNPKVINPIGGGHLIFCWIDISIVDQSFGRPPKETNAKLVGRTFLMDPQENGK